MPLIEHFSVPHLEPWNPGHHYRSIFLFSFCKPCGIAESSTGFVAPQHLLSFSHSTKFKNGSCPKSVTTCRVVGPCQLTFCLWRLWAKFWLFRSSTASSNRFVFVDMYVCIIFIFWFFSMRCSSAVRSCIIAKSWCPTYAWKVFYHKSETKESIDGYPKTS